MYRNRYIAREEGQTMTINNNQLYYIHTDGTTAWSLFEKKYTLSLLKSINQTGIAYLLFQSIPIMSLLLSKCFSIHVQSKIGNEGDLKDYSKLSTT